MFNPGLLHGMLAVHRQPLNGGNVAVEARTQWQDTGTRRASIHMHRAGSALGDTTAILRPSEAEAITQDPQQRCPRLSVDLIRFAIHAQGSHSSTSFCTGFCALGYALVRWLSRNVVRNQSNVRTAVRSGSVVPSLGSSTGWREGALRTAVRCNGTISCTQALGMSTKSVGHSFFSVRRVPQHITYDLSVQRKESGDE